MKKTLVVTRRDFLRGTAGMVMAMGPHNGGGGRPDPGPPDQTSRGFGSG
jgi:hypothetical protein